MSGQTPLRSLLPPPPLSAWTGSPLLPVSTPCPAFFLLVTFSPEEAPQSLSVVRTKPWPWAHYAGALAFPGLMLVAPPGCSRSLTGPWHLPPSITHP